MISDMSQKVKKIYQKLWGGICDRIGSHANIVLQATLTARRNFSKCARCEVLVACAMFVL